MHSIKDMEDLSREQLYSVVNRLQRRVNCLNTDLMRYGISFNQFQAYFSQFEESSETIQQLDQLVKQIKELNRFHEKNVLVSVKKLMSDSKDFSVDEVLVIRPPNQSSDGQQAVNGGPRRRSGDVQQSSVSALSSGDKLQEPSLGKASEAKSMSFRCKVNDCQKTFKTRFKLNKHKSAAHFGDSAQTTDTDGSGDEWLPNGRQSNGVRSSSTVDKVEKWLSSTVQKEPKSVSTKKFRCLARACGLLFSNGALLDNHLQVVHKQKPNKHRFCLHNGCDFKSANNALFFDTN